MKEYIGADIIAADLGVTSATVATWLMREIPGVPKPVAKVRHSRTTHRLWNESSLPEWREWYRGWKMKSPEFQLSQAEANLAKAKKRLESLK